MQRWPRWALNKSAWMLAGLVLVGLPGCVAPIETVYIDYDRLAVPSEGWSPATAAAPVAPIKVSGESFSVGGLSAATETRPVLTTAAELRKLDAQDRARARRSLSAQFQKVADRETDRWFLEQQVKLDKATEERRQKWNAELFARFEKWATARGPLRIDLETISKWNTGRVKNRPDEEVTAAKDRVRKALDDQDRAYFDDRNLALSQLSGMEAKDNTALQGELAQRRLEDFDLSDQRAATLIQSRGSVPEPKLNLKSIEFSAVPGFSVRVPSPQNGPTLAPIRPRLPGYADGEAKRRVMRQARIWAEGKGYRITTRPTDGRDATSELQRWLTERSVGR
ncbi:MAG: hypothetical protein JST35_10390 [Armatimonadetes bacterium]|nr:hypothetical protein [Armatimonadota bacterium]